MKTLVAASIALSLFVFGALCLEPGKISRSKFGLSMGETVVMLPTKKPEIRKKCGVTDSSLSQEDLSEQRKNFDLTDEDKDGRITTKELDVAMRLLGYTLTKAEIKAMIDSVDLDENGTIEFSEFGSLMPKKKKKGNPGEGIQGAFRRFDKDGSGLISPTELQQGIKTLGHDLTDEKIDEMIQNADLDKDGKINNDEFVEIMKEEEITYE